MKIDKRIIIFFMFCLLCLNFAYLKLSAKESEWERIRVSSPLSAPLEETRPEEKAPPRVAYFISPEDVLEIYVWQHGDLNRNVKVAPDGSMSHPLIGRFQVAGLTLGQLEEKLAEALAQYIKYPQVSVSLQWTVGNKVIILGEVNRTGIHTYQGTINLIEAIGLAGDFRESARTDCVLLVRGNLTENPQVKRVNLARIISHGTSDPDLILKPNDVIFVPKSYVADYNKFLNNIRPTIDIAMNILNLRRQVITDVIGRNMKYH